MESIHICGKRNVCLAIITNREDTQVMETKAMGRAFRKAPIVGAELSLFRGDWRRLEETYGTKSRALVNADGHQQDLSQHP